MLGLAKPSERDGPWVIPLKVGRPIIIHSRLGVPGTVPVGWCRATGTCQPKKGECDWYSLNRENMTSRPGQESRPGPKTPTGPPAPITDSVAGPKDTRPESQSWARLGAREDQLPRVPDVLVAGPKSANVPGTPNLASTLVVHWHTQMFLSSRSTLYLFFSGGSTAQGQ